jgi:S-DNA-T family DNA segregation ATPase FtsK/SpoIIIE
VATLVTAVTRTQPEAVPVFFGGRRSPLIGLGVWQHVATDPHEVAELAGQLDAQVTRDGDSSRPLAVVIEGINEFLGTPADAPLVSLIKRLAGNGHLIIAEGEVSALGGSWPLFSAVKSSRTGLALQPDSQDGSSVFKTDFPRTRRSEFPPGRGLLVEGGKTRLTQIAIPE